MKRTPRNTSPPNWILNFFRWFCHPGYVEDIEGDLLERFGTRSQNGKAAGILLVIDVLKLLRPGIIKPFEGTQKLNNYGMFKNYFKTSFRNLKKSPLFSAINIIGLGISMSLGLLMIVFLSEIYSFDDFHVQKDKIYRVNTKYSFGEGSQEENLHATSSIYIGNQIKEQIPGVENLLILRQDMIADLSIDDNAIAITGFYASNTFFDVFDFKLIKGNPKTALSEPNGIVLTESTAKKLFGDMDPIGKTVTVDRNENFQTGTIRGVIEDPPIKSHLQFETLVSLKTLDKLAKGNEVNFRNDPSDCWFNHVYLVLSESAQKDQVSSMLENTNLVPPWGGKITHFLQPLDEIVTSKDWYYGLSGPTFLPNKIHTMIGLTFIVLLSACFNYTNLSLARALRRSKEVAIRKITGATRIQVFYQFIVESVLMSMIALVIGIVLFFIVRPEFLSLPNPTYRGYEMFLLEINYFQLGYFLLFAIGVGCIAGLIPALLLSKIKVGIIHSDAGKLRLFSNIRFRHALVVIQFAMSIGLIMSAVLVHKQYEFATNYDKGFSTQNIVNINMNRNYVDLDVLENEYAKIPEIIGTSRFAYVLGEGWSGHGGVVMTADRRDTIEHINNYIDEKYLDMHGFKVLAGSGFKSSIKKGEKQKNVIVNEEFLKTLNLGSPEEAIGKSVWIKEHGDDNKLIITGVVKNFVNVSLMEAKERPFIFLKYLPGESSYLAVNYGDNDVHTVMEKLEATNNKFDPLHSFDASVYDDGIAKTYEKHMTTYTIISFLAFLAISVSTLGMLGMAVFTIESRMKEISIRKVLGAGVSSLMTLLSHNFLVTVVVAGVIAIPTTLYIVNNKLLNEFKYRADVGLIDIFSGFIIVLLIGILTIGWQIREAALANPSDKLRSE